MPEKPTRKQNLKWIVVFFVRNGYIKGRTEEQHTADGMSFRPLCC